MTRMFIVELFSVLLPRKKGEIDLFTPDFWECFPLCFAMPAQMEVIVEGGVGVGGKN